MEALDTKDNVEQVSEKILNAKNYNAKIFPIYKLFSWDLLFYYSIVFLFLTQAKGLTASNILFSDSFYTLFKFIFQIPSVNLVETLGRRRSLLIANVLVALSVLMFILTKNLSHAILANSVMGIGYALKEICDPSFLRDCITAKEHKGTAFTKIDGKGCTYWYIFDAISSVSCGFLFVINKYFPMLLCLAMCIISCIIAYHFKSYEEPGKKVKLENSSDFKTYFKDLKIAFRNIFKSNRLKALFLFSGLFASIIAIRSTIASSLFSDIGVKEEYFGIIFAILQIFASIAAKTQNFFHKALRNNLLTYFSLVYCIAFLTVGITAAFSKNLTFSFTIIFICFAFQYFIKGAYYTIQKRYLNSFSSSTMSPKIYSADLMVESLFRVVICYIASFLLDVTTTAYATSILGCVFTVAFIFTLDYMKDKIGLQPEEYKKSDIYFTEVH